MLLSFRHPADLAALEYPPLERAIGSYRALAEHHYARCGGAAGLGGASAEQFSWALAIVGSRCLGVSLLQMALMAGNDDDGGSGAGASGDRTTTTAVPPPPPASAATPLAMVTTLYQLAGLYVAPSAAAAAAATDSHPMCDSGCSGGNRGKGAAGGGLASDGGGVIDRGGTDGGAEAGPSPPSHSGDPGGLAATGGQLRMLVPLLDLINHGGVRHGGVRLYGGAGGGGSDEALLSEANVRWELRPPPHARAPPSRCGMEERDGGGGGGGGAGGEGDGGGAGWHVAVVACADLAPGRELLLSYDATATNDAFALHYGFVPRLNPYDDVQLYDSLGHALAWHRAEVEAALAATDKAKATVNKAAPDASPASPLVAEDDLTALYDGAAAAATAAASGSNAADLDGPVKLHAGGRLCPRLAAAFRHLALAAPPGSPVHLVALAPSQAAPAAAAPPERDLYYSDGQAAPADTRRRHLPAAASASASVADPDPDPGRLVSAAVVRRCLELLRARAPLLTDLTTLLRDEQRRQQPPPSPPPPPPPQQQQPQSPAGSPPGAEAAQHHGGALLSPASSSDSGSSGGGGEGGYLAEAVAMDTWVRLLQHYKEALSDLSPELRALAGLAPPPAAMAAPEASDGSPMDHSMPAGMEEGDGGGLEDNDCDGGRAGDGNGRSGLRALEPQRRLALEYRVHKKMVLWDYVIQAHCPRRA